MRRVERTNTYSASVALWTTTPTVSGARDLIAMRGELY